MWGQGGSASIKSRGTTGRNSWGSRTTTRKSLPLARRHLIKRTGYREDLRFFRILDELIDEAVSGHRDE